MTESSSPNLLVCLDLTDIDQAVLAFARSAIQLFPGARIRFLHVVQQYDLPETAPGDQPDKEDAKALNAELQQALLDRIHPSFPDASPDDLLLPTAAEDAAGEVIETARQIKADLLLLGEKQDPRRSRWYGKRIAATAPCKVLIVPETSRLPKESDAPQGQTVLLATDFSPAADPALRWVLQTAPRLKLRLGLHRVRDTSRSFFPFFNQSQAGDSARQTRQLAHKAFQRLNLGGDEAVAFFTCLDEDPHQTEAERLLAAATHYKADLLAVSANGRAGTATTAYGHLIECLGKLRKPRPLLLFPPKDN